MNNLKPCPSCGSEVDGTIHSPIKLQEFAVNGRVSVMCYGCGLAGPLGKGNAQACDAWNALPRHVEPQPIETAPRDGTWILVCRNGFSIWANTLWRGTDWADDLPWVPTHWLPMPPLPEGK